MPGNARRGRPQGKCHRKQTAPVRSQDCIAVRVKGWSKSPPRCWQQQRHGKPHREQDRIGTVLGHGAILARVGFQANCPGWLREVPGNRCPRRMAVTSADAGHTEPGLQAGWHFFFDDFQLAVYCGVLFKNSPYASAFGYENCSATGLVRLRLVAPISASNSSKWRKWNGAEHKPP